MKKLWMSVGNRIWSSLSSQQRKNGFWLGVAVALWAVIMMLPTPPELGMQGQQAVALVAAACVLFGSEAVPLPAIGLLIPVYQVVVSGLDTELVTGWMMSNALLFLMGTLMLVAALTTVRLDKLIALFVLTRVGTNVYAVVFGIIAVSALLAGFMSDAAAALMLAPVLGIISITRETHDRPIPNLTKLLIFAVGFGAIIGSPYTPAGGARNVIMLDYLHLLADVDLTFYDWIIYMAPFTLIMIGVLTLLLPMVFRPELKDLDAAVKSLRLEVEERPFGFAQALVLVVVLTTIVLWLVVGDLFGIGVIAVGAAALLLVSGTVDWRDYQRDVDWGVLMIYIGAISLGGYTAETGAASWLAAEFLNITQQLGIDGGNTLVLFVSGLVTAMTSTMSAGATTSVMGPIVLDISAQTGISPVIMGLATAMASSFGFMLIVSTPGNAIIYASGYLRATDFIKVGFLSMIAAFVVLFAMLFLYWPMLV